MLLLLKHVVCLKNTWSRKCLTCFPSLSQFWEHRNLLRKKIAKLNPRLQSNSSGVGLTVRSTGVKLFCLFIFQWIGHRDVVPCTNKSGKVVTVCPYNSTCCDSRFSSSGQGCCLLPQAVPCGDGKHCCPAGYGCDPDCSMYRCSCQKQEPQRVSSKNHTAHI